MNDKKTPGCGVLFLATGVIGCTFALGATVVTHNWPAAWAWFVAFAGWWIAIGAHNERNPPRDTPRRES